MIEKLNEKTAFLFRHIWVRWSMRSNMNYVKDKNNVYLNQNTYILLQKYSEEKQVLKDIRNSLSIIKNGLKFKHNINISF